MMMSAFVMQMTENDRPKYAGDAVLLRGDNVSAMSWLNRCGGTRDKRAALVVRIMGRLEITSGWSHKAKHIPGVLNVLADGISRWQPDQIAEKLRSHVNEGDWRQVPLGQISLEFLSTLLQPALPKETVDEGMWNLLTHDTSLSSRMSYRYNRDTKRGGGRDDTQVANLVEILARASVGDSTQKVYGKKWRAWCYARAAQEKSPWLVKTHGVEAAVVALTEFMALRCFTFKNQNTTIRGYLSAIEHYPKMFGGWELPTDHHMVVATGKGIDRAHGRSDVRPKVRKPLTWDMLVQVCLFSPNAATSGR